MNKAKQKNSIRIICFVVIQTLLFVDCAWCLSPAVSVDVESIQKSFAGYRPARLKRIYWEERSNTAEMMFSFFKGQLADQGYELFSVFDEQDLRDNPPQLAILNPEAAKGRGHILRSITPGIRILIVSGYDLKDADVASMGGHYYLHKPFSLEKFLSTIEQAAADIAAGTGKLAALSTLPEWCEYAPARIDDYSWLKDQLGIKTLEYQDRIVIRKRDGALFFVRTKYRPEKVQEGDFIWPEKNDPTREYIAFRFGREIQANVCDIILPAGRQAQALAKYVGATPQDIHLVRISGDYRLQDAEVMRKDFRKAFTRNLVLAILIRKYDFHRANHQPVKDADVPMMFDNEQSFHENFSDIQQFALAFIDNYFPSAHYGIINPDQLLGEIDFEELSDAVTFCEQELNMDAMRTQIMAMIDSVDYFEGRQIISYVESRQLTFRVDVLDFFRTVLDFNASFSLNRFRNLPEKPRFSIMDISRALLPASLDAPAAEIEFNNELLEQAI